MQIDFIEILNKRTEFEDITKEFNMPPGSCIDTIEWFVENGHRSNSLRNGFDMAVQLAKSIKEYSDECEKTRAWIEV